jgi:cytidylate kinase
MEGLVDKHSFIVTVSRQMGSKGTYVGLEVAKRLGFSYIDREILQQAAHMLGSDEDSVAEYEEKSSGLIRNLMKVFALGTPEVAYVPKERPIYDKDVFLLESKIIRDIAEKSNAVIMGRGGFSVLKDRPNTMHLFVRAPHTYRVEQLIKTGIAANEQEALALIEESDRRRTKFVKDMLGIEWSDVRNYHLSVDSSSIGPEETVGMVVSFIEKAFGLTVPVQNNTTT